jgi:hypothetical protein
VAIKITIPLSPLAGDSAGKKFIAGDSAGKKDNRSVALDVFYNFLFAVGQTLRRHTDVS